MGYHGGGHHHGHYDKRQHPGVIGHFYDMTNHQDPILNSEGLQNAP